MNGWICPVCGRGLSPYIMICPCHGENSFSEYSNRFKTETWITCPQCHRTHKIDEPCESVKYTDCLGVYQFNAN